MTAERARIVPKLGTFDAAMVVVSLVIGIGIFRTPAIVAKETGTPLLFFLAWTVGGLVSLAGALTFAEIGSRRPRAGGYYRVVADAYSPLLAFMLNWAQALMQGTGAAGVAFIGVEYLLPVVLPARLLGPRANLAGACALMLVLLLVNFAGVKTGSRTQNALSLLKIVLIVALAATAVLLATRPDGAPESAASPGRFAAALVPVFYAFGGYQMTMNLGADVKDAPRRFPLAILLGMATVVALYLLIDFAYVKALGVSGVASSNLVAAALAKATLGRAGEVAVSIVIFFSAAGFVNATILQMPRSFTAMAEDGLLPRAFLAIDEATQVARAGLAFFGVTMLVPAFLLGSFEKLLDYVMFTDSLTLAVVASTLFVFRRRDAKGESGDVFRMPAYPILPALYLAVLVVLLIQLLVHETRLALVGSALLVIGAPLFFFLRRLRSTP